MKDFLFSFFSCFLFLREIKIRCFSQFLLSPDQYFKTRSLLKAYIISLCLSSESCLIMVPRLLGRREGWDSVLPLRPLLGTLSGSPRKKGYFSWCTRNEVNPHFPSTMLTVMSCTTRADSPVIGYFMSCFHCTLNPFMFLVAGSLIDTFNCPRPAILPTNNACGCPAPTTLELQEA